MHYTNMTFRFVCDNEVTIVPLKTIVSIKETYAGILVIATNDYVLYTINMDEKLAVCVMDMYDDWLWDMDSSMRTAEFQVYSVIGRLNLDGEE